MSVSSLTYQQSVFKRYRSDKHFSEFYLQDGGNNQLAEIWNKITSLSLYVYSVASRRGYKCIGAQARCGGTETSCVFLIRNKCNKIQFIDYLSVIMRSLCSIPSISDDETSQLCARLCPTYQSCCSKPALVLNATAYAYNFASCDDHKAIIDIRCPVLPLVDQFEYTPLYGIHASPLFSHFEWTSFPRCLFWSLCVQKLRHPLKPEVRNLSQRRQLRTEPQT